MPLWRAAYRWIRLRLGPSEDEVEREIRSHLDLEIEEARDAGLSPEAAERAARRTFGNPAVVREAVHDVWTWRWLDEGVADIRCALRTLRKAPGFVMASGLTMALGIGATTATLSVVSAVLLRPLPYADPDQLVLVWQELKARHLTEFPFPAGDVADLRRQATVFEGLATIQTSLRSLSTGAGEPEHVRLAEVSPNIFGLLGVKVALGRDFVEADGTPPASPSDAAMAPPLRVPIMVVLSHELWQKRFDSRPDLANLTVELDAGRAQVVGVVGPGVDLLLPPRTRVETHPDLWAATRADFTHDQRTTGEWQVLARLKPGVPISQAQQQMDGIAADLRRRFPMKQTANVTIDVEPMHRALVSDVRPALLALAGAVTFVFLIACCSVMNLLLARAARCERGLALRAALGATRGRLVRHVLTESLIVSLGGSALGLLLAVGGMRAVVGIAPSSLPHLEHAEVSVAVLAVAVLVSLISAVAVGLGPALRASAADFVEVPHRSGRIVASSTGQLQGRLVVAEVTLACVLLVGSGLMMRSVIALQHANPGYDTSHVLTLFTPKIRGATPEKRAAFMKAVQDALKALPGVENASAVSPLPLDGAVTSVAWGTAAAAADPTLFQQATLHTVLPGYFETLHTPLVAGRTFSEADNRPEERTVVIDTRLADKAFPGERAVGQHLLVRLNGMPVTFDVIGVVAHQRQASLAEDGREGLFLTDASFGAGIANCWVVRTTGDPLELGAAAKSVIAPIDPKIATYLLPMQAFVNRSAAPTQFALILLGAFATVAVALATLGLCGVLAAAVRQRTAEIGVRMALGATRSAVFGLVVGQGMRLSAVGAGLGVLVAFALTPTLRTVLAGVSPDDPLTFAAIAGLVLCMGFFACGLPALRASRLDPTSALREE